MSERRMFTENQANLDAYARLDFAVVVRDPMTISERIDAIRGDLAAIRSDVAAVMDRLDRAELHAEMRRLGVRI